MISEGGELLYKYKKKDKELFLRYIINHDERRKILVACHVHPTSGHMGKTRTLGRVKERFMWHGMAKNVHELLISCDVCQRMNRKLNCGKPEMHPIKVKAAWYMVGIDFIGPLSPISENGCKCILTINDYFSKWVEVIATKDKMAVTVAECLFKVITFLFLSLF
ncbi:uncharacterized protein LOC124808109 [Hydra vulgaris]|uniref:uncharacterized protein LOC124808109 n=1 Tax=Hydra vulgaris TaxID=6087 RepID=UPI001F5F2799|nr:uncharacterized protein LOC124808109 [Hydra vulgaris]